MYINIALYCTISRNMWILTMIIQLTTSWMYMINARFLTYSSLMFGSIVRVFYYTRIRSLIHDIYIQFQGYRRQDIVISGRDRSCPRWLWSVQRHLGNI
ncbi:hypothetical protein F4781DRAFT_261462 [Annulohypoxylon bovei var. microspora]|nr:hypothetical protein F4781DRAFT_261462 [Annulohypoxylon bovei var. microspora]